MRIVFGVLFLGIAVTSYVAAEGADLEQAALVKRVNDAIVRLESSHPSGLSLQKVPGAGNQWVFAHPKDSSAEAFGADFMKTLSNALMNLDPPEDIFTKYDLIKLGKKPDGSLRLQLALKPAELERRATLSLNGNPVPYLPAQLNFDLDNRYAKIDQASGWAFTAATVNVDAVRPLVVGEKVEETGYLHRVERISGSDETTAQSTQRESINGMQTRLKRQGYSQEYIDDKTRAALIHR